jgi:hypothetical protein
MADAPRRFPPPWRADKTAHGYVVRDANGQALAYLYSRATEAEAMQAKVLTADEARRVWMAVRPEDRGTRGGRGTERPRWLTMAPAGLSARVG